MALLSYPFIFLYPLYFSFKLIATAIGIGVGYYVKVYKKKLEAEDEENEVLEDEMYENEDDNWDNDEIADTEDE